MVRPRKPRFVRREPPVKFFKPQGIPLRELETVSLTIEELEALRLADKEGLAQEEASEHMGVSRPTFQRILSSARNKVANGLVDGSALVIEGGDFIYTRGKRTFECLACGHRWSEPAGTGRARDAVCPACGGAARRAGAGRGRGRGPGGASGGRRPV